LYFGFILYYEQRLFGFPFDERKCPSKFYPNENHPQHGFWSPSVQFQPDFRTIQLFFLDMSTATLMPFETVIVSIILEVFAFIIHVLYYAYTRRDREKFVCWEFYTKRVAGERNIVCQCPFLSRNSLMIFWNSWPAISGQWSFRLTHGVVADAGWVDRVANVSQEYDDFHLTGTYTEKGLLIKFYACVKY